MIFHLINKTKYIGRNEKNTNKLSIYLGRFAKGLKFRPRYFLIYIQILRLSVFCLVSTCIVEVSNITSPNGALLIIKQEYPLTADKKCHKKMKFLSRETKLSLAI